MKPLLHQFRRALARDRRGDERPEIAPSTFRGSSSRPPPGQARSRAKDGCAPAAPRATTHRALPLELYTSVAGHLESRRDLANFERAYGCPVPGLYTALGRGQLPRIVLPLLPAVRAMHLAHPAVAARELPPTLPDWELRFLVDFGAPVDALRELPFAAAEQMLRGLRSLAILRGTYLLHQVERSQDEKYEELLIQLLAGLHDAYVQALESHQLDVTWLERSLPVARAVALRMGEGAVEALEETVTCMQGWRLRQSHRPLQGAERSALSSCVFNTWLVFGQARFDLRGPF